MTAARHSELFALLDITGEDAAQCAALLDSPAGPGVVRAMAALRERLGTFPSGYAKAEDTTELDWIEALLRFAPELLEFHSTHGIAPELTAAILGDLGLQLRINRRVHGDFGLDTWGWLTLHMAGNMFRLGRLQYHLIREVGTEAGSLVPDGQWILGVHIPEDSGLSPALVDESLTMAKEFFARFFPERPVAEATCDSWMLDPYLAAKLPESNIASFARRFTVGRCTDEPTDAVYFTFRQRGLDRLDKLPRETSLQRVVLERIDDGGTWQIGHGRLSL
ncbi:acyltransferase domain-containing protein [Arthrobacter sp. CJ23]|uniref:acyltransferase domain-containing protein n=1 Tax=Arthrobacter sp. CJ23 TaxID=2972479 RepID=UPI00215BADFE|nr:acyltransferase domain-containing protein [Arthrobacter sp. CJ23]UVJ37998.1 acyltransferase domain-containing protein [Arthrobacter sp. CJ23]